jgi:16S rRNA (uracil1498-N3)-methyltransferase
MRLTRIFIDSLLESGATLALPEGPAKHISRVLRAEVGAMLRVFNSQGGEYDATVESIHRDKVSVVIGAHHAINRESPLYIILLQGIARGEKMDLILQKATELGITGVVPVTMTRSTVRLDSATALRKREHWQAVVVSACEQCGRNIVPAVAPPISLAAALAATGADLKLLLSPDDQSATLPALLQATANTDLRSICLLVGPEGGFDATEIAIARNAGFQTCRLGPRILRTETAALTALVALQSLAGDLR